MLAELVYNANRHRSDFRGYKFGKAPTTISADGQNSQLLLRKRRNGKKKIQLYVMNMYEKNHCHELKIQASKLLQVFQTRIKRIHSQKVIAIKVHIILYPISSFQILKNVNELLH